MNLTATSKLFSEVELAKECDEHFVEELLGKSCSHPPIKHKTPTFVQRMLFEYLFIQSNFPICFSRICLWLYCSIYRLRIIISWFISFANSL